MFFRPGRSLHARLCPVDGAITDQGKPDGLVRARKSADHTNRIGRSRRPGSRWRYAREGYRAREAGTVYLTVDIKIIAAFARYLGASQLPAMPEQRAGKRRGQRTGRSTRADGVSAGARRGKEQVGARAGAPARAWSRCPGERVGSGPVLRGFERG
ncbi:hypothetical protein C2E23DRAFT_361444 [Lenzites betulinus]|nr:hypothetical protein C2E23DRAFT_361444 [Lenzites betulinus]